MGLRSYSLKLHSWDTSAELPCKFLGTKNPWEGLERARYLQSESEHRNPVLLGLCPQECRSVNILNPGHPPKVLGSSQLCPWLHLLLKHCQRKKKWRWMLLVHNSLGLSSPSGGCRVTVSHSLLCPWTLTDCFKKLKDIENHNLGSWGARRGVCYEIYLVSVLYLAREAMDSQIFRKKNVLHLVNVHHNSNNNALLECRVRKTRIQAEKKHWSGTVERILV